MLSPYMPPHEQVVYNVAPFTASSRTSTAACLTRRPSTFISTLARVLLCCGLRCIEEHRDETRREEAHYSALQPLCTRSVCTLAGATSAVGFSAVQSRSEVLQKMAEEGKPLSIRSWPAVRPKLAEATHCRARPNLLDEENLSPRALVAGW